MHVQVVLLIKVTRPSFLGLFFYFILFFFYVLVAVASLDFKVPIIGLPNGLGLWIFVSV